MQNILKLTALAHAVAAIELASKDLFSPYDDLYCCSFKFGSNEYNGCLDKSSNQPQVIMSVKSSNRAVQSSSYDFFRANCDLYVEAFICPHGHQEVEQDGLVKFSCAPGSNGETDEFHVPANTASDYDFHIDIDDLPNFATDDDQDIEFDLDIHMTVKNRKVDIHMSSDNQGVDIETEQSSVILSYYPWVARGETYLKTYAW